MVNALRFTSDPTRFLEGIQARFPEMAEIPIPGGPSIMAVTSPELIHDAMARPEEFSRIPASGAAALIAENGLVQTEGDLWRRQRDVISRGFDGERTRTYADAVGRGVERTAERWRDATAAGGTEVDLHRAMTGVTVRAATEAMFDEDIGAERAARMHDFAAEAAAEFEIGPTTVAPDWLPLPTSDRARSVAAGLREMGEGIIERRRAAFDGDAPPVDERPDDMLGAILWAEAHAGAEFPENHVRDQVVSFLIAGHETTALGTTYTLSLLSDHPGIRERVREEARTVMGDDRPGHEHAGDLTYTGRVFTEALRLYPPAWAVFRRTTAEVRLGDYRLPEGAIVILPQWSVHRDPRHFDRPTEFDPDRWLDRDPGDADPYFAFASGPHACIGRGFALTGARLVIAGLVREFDVDAEAGALDDLLVTPTLRPGNGVTARIRRTERADAGERRRPVAED